MKPTKFYRHAGSPLTRDYRKSAAIKVRMPEEEIEVMREMAGRSGLGVSEFVREMIAREIRRLQIAEVA